MRSDHADWLSGKSHGWSDAQGHKSDLNTRAIPPLWSHDRLTHQWLPGAVQSRFYRSMAVPHKHEVSLLPSLFWFYLTPIAVNRVFVFHAVSPPALNYVWSNCLWSYISRLSMDESQKDCQDHFSVFHTDSGAMPPQRSCRTHNQIIQAPQDSAP